VSPADRQSSATRSNGADAPGSTTIAIRVALAVVVLAALLAVGRVAGGYLPHFARWVDGLGVVGPLVFIAGYVVATVAFAPGSILTLAAGAIFGLVEGTLYVFVAATLGASAAFLVARYVARSAIQSRIEGNARFAAIDRAVAEQGLWIVFLLRLSPIFPYNLLNYALGLTRVSFADYFVASAGMLPATVLYVYYGKVAGDVAAAVGGAGAERDAAGNLVLVLGLVATVVVTAVVTRAARRALEGVADG